MNSKTKIFVVGTLALVLGAAVIFSATSKKEEPVKEQKIKTECCKSKASTGEDATQALTTAEEKDGCAHKEHRCCGSDTPCNKKGNDKCCGGKEKATEKTEKKSCCKKG